MSGAKPGESSADFVTAFAALARRLDAIGVTVSNLRIYYSRFRSWELLATKGHQAVRIFFDGREGFFTAEVSPVRKHSAPSEWERVDAKGISGGYQESIAYAEEFLHRSFGKESEGTQP